MSAGEFFDLIRPAVLVVSAVISTWVLASARKRFRFYQALLWALGTLFFPLIFLPLYLVVLLFVKRRQPRSATDSMGWRFALPLLYAVVVLFSIAVYLYRDESSVDAHLARATQHKINNETGKTIAEYQQALALEDNPHTHKLLAIELANAGYSTDAITEFRLALRGGEPDDSIHFHIGTLLDRINHHGEADLEYKEFLNTKACTKNPVDFRCEAAARNR